jgi:hypothetical protein
MALTAWSTAFRQSNTLVRCLVGVAKETAEAETGSVDVYINDSSTPLATGVAVTSTLADEVQFNAQSNTFVDPDYVNQEVVEGQVIRGVVNVPVITDPANTDFLGLDKSYRLIVKNTGTTPIVISKMLASPYMVFPGETTDTTSFPAEVDSASKTAFEAMIGRLESMVPAVASLDSMINNFPAELTALFAGLSASSTTDDFNSIVADPVFTNYYGNVFLLTEVFDDLVQANCGRAGIVQSDGSVTPNTSATATISPGQEYALVLTKVLAKYISEPYSIHS